MSTKGIKQTPEHVASRVEARAGWKHTDEAKQKIAESRVGYKNSPETRLKISKANRGKNLSELSQIDTMRDPRPGYRGYFAANTIDDIRHKARKRGKEWTISSVAAYYLIISKCSYCGFAPNWPNSRVGIDRVDNNKGYEPGNCVSCCSTCNSAKGELTRKEFLAWIKQIYNHNKQEIENE